MKIYAALIVKDDSEYHKLLKALASIVNYVDGIYITTTGTNVDKIKALPNIHHSLTKWKDDFAAARNFNFEHVPKDADYIFWMDADDILLGGEHLRELAQQAKANSKDVVFLTYWYGCAFDGEPNPETLQEVQMEQMRERLLKPGVTTWKGRLHETPIPVKNARNNYTTYAYDKDKRPIVVMHTSTDNEIEEKMLRNRRILEVQLKEERQNESADPRTLLYLMKIYAEMDDPKLWEEVIPMGQEYLTKSGWDEERATCLEQMGICYAKMGKTPDAIRCFHQALAEWPFQPLIVIRLATAYFNAKNYKFCKYYMDMAGKMDIDNKGSNLTNMKAMKLMFSELSLKYLYNVAQDTKKSVEAAKLLYQESPTDMHLQQVETLTSQDALNDACLHTDKLAQYLDVTGESNRIPTLLNNLPEAIVAQPFAIRMRHQFTEPRRWNDDEICYFANFGTHGFEKWDSSSLKKGIGGSETAVIKLAEEWAGKGYHVTIYGDPITKGGQYFSLLGTGSVTYLPWYYFNPNDAFNIFIAWRAPSLAGKIKARRYYVDMHDVYNEVDFIDKLPQIDKIMVKSQYHRELSPNIPDDKFMTVGNGVDL